MTEVPHPSCLPSSFGSAKVDALKTLSVGASVFGAKGLREHLELLVNDMRREMFATTSDVIQKAIEEAATALARTVAGKEKDFCVCVWLACLLASLISYLVAVLLAGLLACLLAVSHNLTPFPTLTRTSPYVSQTIDRATIFPSCFPISRR